MRGSGRSCRDHISLAARFAGVREVTECVIGPEGRVDKALVVRDEVRSPSLACCVLRTVRERRFPKPKGGGVAVARAPFMFFGDTSEQGQERCDR